MLCFTLTSHAARKLKWKEAMLGTTPFLKLQSHLHHPPSH
jgi:hypothetical protein